MSLSGAKKQPETLKEVLKRAKENYEKKMESPSEASAVSSSHIGRLLNKVMGPVSDQDQKSVTVDSEAEFLERQYHGTQEYERLKAEDKQEEYECGLRGARIKDDLRRREDSQATSRVETGQLPSNLDDMRAYSDLMGKTGVTGITRYGTDESSDLSSPQVTSYAGSEISFRHRRHNNQLNTREALLAFHRAPYPWIRLQHLWPAENQFWQKGIFSRRKIPACTQPWRKRKKRRECQ